MPNPKNCDHMARLAAGVILWIQSQSDIIIFNGAIAKWSKATVCKTVIRGFKSRSHLSNFKIQMTSSMR